MDESDCMSQNDLLLGYNYTNMTGPELCMLVGEDYNGSDIDAQDELDVAVGRNYDFKSVEDSAATQQVALTAVAAAVATLLFV